MVYPSAQTKTASPSPARSVLIVSPLGFTPYAHLGSFSGQLRNVRQLDFAQIKVAELDFRQIVKRSVGAPVCGSLFTKPSTCARRQTAAPPRRARAADSSGSQPDSPFSLAHMRPPLARHQAIASSAGDEFPAILRRRRPACHKADGHAPVIQRCPALISEIQRQRGVLLLRQHGENLVGRRPLEEGIPARSMPARMISAISLACLAHAK